MLVVFGETIQYILYIFDQLGLVTVKPKNSAHTRRGRYKSWTRSTWTASPGQVGLTPIDSDIIKKKNEKTESFISL